MIKMIKIVFLSLLLFQFSFAHDEKIKALASTIATPFYNVYNNNVIELLDQYVQKNPDIQAIKIFDTLIEKNSIVYYKIGDMYVSEIDKDFPVNLELPNRTSSIKIVKNQKTIGVLTLYYSTKVGDETLTKEESEYLNNKKNIRMCVDPNWLPFEKIENGKHIGLTSEIIKLFAQNLKIPIVLVPTINWQESLDFAKNRKCDILSLVSRTPERERYMDFTTPYIDAPIVLATRNGIPFIDNLQQVIDKQIGVVKGYSLHELLRTRYPNINLVEVDSIADGLKKVENGKLFGYLDNSIVLNYEIQKNHIGTLAISGKFENHFLLGLATRNDEPILLQIFQKAVKSVSQNDKEQIYKRWVSNKIEKIKVTDYSLVYQVTIFSILVLLIFVYWNRKIVKTNKELETAKKEIEKLAITDKLTGLYNRAKLDEILEIEIERCRRFNHDMAFCILDIDCFKSINDNFGHQVGDKVLMEISDLLIQSTRKIDFVGRWGGEEFIIICPETGKNGALTFLENLREKIETYKFPNVGKITASFGLTLLDKDDDSIKIVKRADEALYEAKKNGRNKVIFI